MTRLALLLSGIAPLVFAVPAAAQSMDHSMHGSAAPAPATKPAAKAPACPPDHAAMGHCTPDAETPQPSEPDAEMPDMGTMDHGTPAPSDPDCPPEHASMGHCTPKAPAPDAMGGASGTDLPPGDAPAPSPPTDWYADRIFPGGAMEHSRHEMMKEGGDQKIAFVSLNLAEYQARKGRDGFRWEGEGWYGGDINRLTVKSEGEAVFGEGIESGEVQALYSRAIGPYFNAQAGVRQDFGHGPDRTYATIGVEGLAPYWFEVEGALFLSNKGDLLARLEASYDQRLTQKLILQPAAEVNFAAQDVPESGIGSGLSDVELGLRLRYEVVKEFAPYVGVEWARKVGDSARFARAAGEDASGVSFVMGIKAWF
ncbi:copper resistance protein CopB [Sphingopyxis sp. Root1497]|uniref:copper resistance protein B n=1 Tax=Sphingopyxis sp. Root1497 TaxID=1736474 RepID=UPI0006FF836E|nr:copper resistance protein B [Sphingopyxis sp. Root1497]KQZ64811.1 copper resistance protein CopB [Sphingopyxis sp. Root1497]